MKNIKKVKCFDLYSIDKNVKQILINYYQNNNCVERSYIGSDENLLKVFTKYLNVASAVYSSFIEFFFRFSCDREGKITLMYSNLFGMKQNYELSLDELVCKNRIVKSLNSNMPKAVEDELTLLMYILNFKLEYPYAIERFKVSSLPTQISVLENNKSWKSYTITESSICRIVYFPFADKFERENFDLLPEFLVTPEAVKMIDEKVGANYFEDVLYPFSEFVISLEEYHLVCKLSDDKNKIRMLLKNNNNSKNIFMANCDTDLKEGFSLLVLNGYDKNIYGEIKEFAAKFMAIAVQILYYYSHYKIDCEVRETPVSNTNNKHSNVNKRKNTSTIIVPRKVIKIDKERIKTAKKRRKPLYSVKSWKRAAHIRRYRDADGNVIKEVEVRESTCNRKAEISESIVVPETKKLFKISTEAMGKATRIK